MKKLLTILAVTACIMLLPVSYSGAEGMTEIRSVSELHLKNLEYQVYHSCQYYELEDFEGFWSLMRNLTE